MEGRLALAGMNPDETPLPQWVAATFAALTELPNEIEKLDEFLDKLSEPFPGEERDDLDPDTWGTSEIAQDAQAKLLATWGKPAAAVD